MILPINHLAAAVQAILAYEDTGGPNYENWDQYYDELKAAFKEYDCFQSVIITAYDLIAQLDAYWGKTNAVGKHKHIPPDCLVEAKENLYIALRDLAKSCPI